MPNNTIVGIYYNSDGKVVKIVHADNDDYTPHEQEGLTCVFVDREIYDSLPAAFNMGGMPNHFDLHKAVVDVLAANPLPTRSEGDPTPSLQDMIQTQVTATEDALAAEAAARAAEPIVNDPEDLP